MKPLITYATLIVVVTLWSLSSTHCSSSTPSPADTTSPVPTPTPTPPTPKPSSLLEISTFMGRRTAQYRNFINTTDERICGSILMGGRVWASLLGYYFPATDERGAIGWGSSFPIWVNFNLNGKQLYFWNIEYDARIFGREQVKAGEFMKEFYGQDVHISLDASKDKIQDTLYDIPFDPGTFIVIAPLYSDIWKLPPPQRPAVDTTIYMAQRIAWLPSEIATQNDTVLKLPYTIKWNADTRNANGVGILIQYFYRENSPLIALQQPETVHVPIDAADNGSFVLEKEHFEHIPDHAKVRITIGRGSYGFLRDRRSDAKFSFEFMSEATKHFTTLTK